MSLALGLCFLMIGMRGAAGMVRVAVSHDAKLTLRVVNYDDIGVEGALGPERVICAMSCLSQTWTTWTSRARWAKVKLTVLLDPSLEHRLVRVIDLDTIRRHTLEDVVELALRDVEDGRVALGHIPAGQHVRTSFRTLTT